MNTSMIAKMYCAATLIEPGVVSSMNGHSVSTVATRPDRLQKLCYLAVTRQFFAKTGNAGTLCLSTAIKQRRVAEAFDGENQRWSIACWLHTR